ncbi:hypothetical protein Dimus_027151 [Dionaea muscipula]
MTARADRSEQRRAPTRSKASPARFDVGKLRSTFLLFRFVDLGCDWFNFVDFWGISDLGVVCGRMVSPLIGKLDFFDFLIYPVEFDAKGWTFIVYRVEWIWLKVGFGFGCQLSLLVVARGSRRGAGV